jgi:hypothetical protein
LTPFFGNFYFPGREVQASRFITNIRVLGHNSFDFHNSPVIVESERVLSNGGQAGLKVNGTAQQYNEAEATQDYGLFVLVRDKKQG